jgi:hypothetical protein
MHNQIKIQSNRGVGKMSSSFQAEALPTRLTNMSEETKIWGKKSRGTPTQAKIGGTDGDSSMRELCLFMATLVAF